MGLTNCRHGEAETPWGMSQVYSELDQDPVPHRCCASTLRTHALTCTRCSPARLSRWGAIRNPKLPAKALLSQQQVMPRVLMRRVCERKKHRSDMGTNLKTISTLTLRLVNAIQTSSSHLVIRASFAPGSRFQPFQGSLCCMTVPILASRTHRACRGNVQVLRAFYLEAARPRARGRRRPDHHPAAGVAHPPDRGARARGPADHSHTVRTCQLWCMAAFASIQPACMHGKCSAPVMLKCTGHCGAALS